MPDFTTVFFDLDATLYPEENGLWPQIGENIASFVREEMGVPEPEVRPLMYRYYEEYGTTLRGLQLKHGIDPYVYLDYVHDIPVDQYLVPDPGLRAVLGQLTLPKWVFTNSDSRYSRRVLDTLGIADCFGGVIALDQLGFVSKPDPEAYKRALAIAGEPDPARAVFLEDSARNLEAARQLGMMPVLVRKGPLNEDGFLQIPRPHDLPAVLPELFGS